MEKGYLRARLATPFHHPVEKKQDEGSGSKTIVMAKTIILLLFFIITATAAYAQRLTLSLKNAALEKLFTQIEQQSSYHFIYTREELDKAKPVTISMTNAVLESVMDHCMKGQPLEYSIREPYIIIRRKGTAPVSRNTAYPISGRIVNEQGEPVIGATILIKGTKIATASNENGEWKLDHDGSNSSLTISSIGYVTKEISVSKDFAYVVLQRAVGSLDETVVIAYGKTTRRLNTGNVVKVTAEEIARQPVSNALATLQGRVPGLEITQNSGVPGAGFAIQIRGINSLTQGTEPLILVDGLPFGNGNKQINQINNSAQGGVSPFNTINVADIESIEVLKDADATAIYGSRGANGVILITTKRGKVGKTLVSARVRSGFSKATRTMELLNTQQYLEMRREAFQNDGVTPTPSNAPDLFEWDTSNYTDFRKMFTGGTARTNDVQISITGGTDQTQFLLSGGYTDETGFLSNAQSLKKKTFHFSLNHQTADKKAGIDLNGSYVITNSDLLQKDLASYINMAPHFPLYDSNVNLNWMVGNAPLTNYAMINPLAMLKREYDGEFNNLSLNVQLYYSIFKNLKLRVSQGFQLTSQDEISRQPKGSLDPNSTQLGMSTFVNGSIKSWQTEPQLEYNAKYKRSQFKVLVGATFQELINKSNYITAYNYNSDLLLNSPAAAPNLIVQNDYSQYRYTAVFARLNYNFRNTLLVNITGRRDGSSRFGPQNRFSNFGAMGAGWIFSENIWMKKNFKFLSYGKLRASWGITGNDQIGNYIYFDSWSNPTSSSTYQGVIGLSPTRLFNPSYTWERNDKWEASLELGFIKDRILLSSTYYQNRCGNQLVNYSLPAMTGFITVQENFNAVFRNSGFEWLLETRNINGKNIRWATSFNLSIPRNKLLSFPGLENTSYRNTFVVGRPISERRVYEFQGINPVSGVYQYHDVDSNGLMDNADRVGRINPAVRFYGGLQNSISYKRLQIDFLFEFRSQIGRNYLSTQGSFIPGYLYSNHPVLVLDRWQKPGDQPLVQRYAAVSSSPAIPPTQAWLSNSNGIYGDASYIRLKNVGIQYTVEWKNKNLLNVFTHIQNLCTFSKYMGADPENQNLYVMPPLRTITFGVQVNIN